MVVTALANAMLFGQAARAEGPATGAQAVSPPVQEYSLSLSQLANASDFKLFGVSNQQNLEFTLRRDQLTTQAALNLVFTPSPALLPKLSHVRVYLNDELMRVVPIETEPAGQRQSHSVPLDLSFLSTYNRIRLEFVGHYTDICEDPAHSSLWLDLSRQTTVELQQEALAVANDLSFFPEPFLDGNDMLPQSIPFVLPQSPSNEILEAAAVLASYMGIEAKWRDVRFPVSYGVVPTDHHAIVFATNDLRPELLRDYPAVDKPVVALISAPDNPYRKLLLVLGRNDEDIKTAVSALALGGPLLRGQSIQIEEITPLEPRRPYDAPSWIPTDRPVLFSELTEYPAQLEVEGLRPRPIRLNLNVAPDLFVWRSNGIPLDVIYRYSSPLQRDGSRLTLSLNERFVTSYHLESQDERSALARMRLKVVGNDASDMANVVVPALRIGTQNQLGLDFSFATAVGNSEAGTCRTVLPVAIRAAIDGRSSIDFSGYAHYLEMPNLRAFANSGFPFSRMADLSETVVVMPKDAEPTQVSALLQTAALIGAQTGYPAYRVAVVDDWAAARQRDTDILWIGATPDEFRHRPDANLLLNHTTSILTQPLRRHSGEAAPARIEYQPQGRRDQAVQLAVRSVAPMAAIVGMQSPYFPKRSMVGLLATSPDDFKLLEEGLRDSGKRSAMYGSVVILRTSGVASEMVGPRYFVGDLHWWQRLWFHLSDRPLLLAFAAAVAVLLLALLLWVSLKWVAHRRLSKDA